MRSQLDNVRKLLFKDESMSICICQSFPPIADERARVLILGSMPSQISLQQQQYYANPNNKFWTIIYELIGKTIPDTYEKKKADLKDFGIALWDVLAHCEREGSLDSAIKNESPNNFNEFLGCHNKIEVVVFNGTKARDMWKRHVSLENNKILIFHTLPSTSPAYTKPLPYKMDKWKIIRMGCFI